MISTNKYFNVVLLIYVIDSIFENWGETDNKKSNTLCVWVSIKLFVVSSRLILFGSSWIGALWYWETVWSRARQMLYSPWTLLKNANKKWESKKIQQQQQQHTHTIDSFIQKAFIPRVFDLVSVISSSQSFA